MDLLLHSEGCEDPGIPAGTCGVSRIETNGIDVSLHSRGINIAIIDFYTGNCNKQRLH